MLKNRKIKNNKEGSAKTCFRGACPTKSFRRGFALLFSVLISSLLLTIGLSIFGIALKELAISTATRQSVHAFYAADSGRECALYWDTKRGQIPNFFGLDSEVIECAGLGINVVDSDQNNENLILVNIRDAQDPISVLGLNDPGPNYYVQIKKEIFNPEDTARAKITTVINSFGQDSTGGDRVQRAIYQILNY